MQPRPGASPPQVFRNPWALLTRWRADTVWKDEPFFLLPLPLPLSPNNRKRNDEQELNNRGTLGQGRALALSSYMTLVGLFSKSRVSMQME